MLPVGSLGVECAFVQRQIERPVLSGPSPSAEEKIILMFVKDCKEDFIQGTAAMGVCRRQRRLGSTLNKTRKSEDLSPRSRVGGQWMENYYQETLGIRGDTG